MATTRLRPQALHHNIIIDFIVDLPANKNKFGASIKNALIITDRFNKIIYIIFI